MSNRTLRAIRQGVSETDKSEPALVPSEAPYWATARDGSRYMHVTIYPQTINQLRKLSRDYGEAAIAELYRHSVTVWLMNKPHDAELSNPFRVAMVACLLVNERARIRSGWPRHDGEDWPPPTLDGLSPDVQREAELVAGETLSDWKKAGRPYLSQQKIKATYRYLISTSTFAAKYVSADDGDRDC